MISFIVPTIGRLSLMQTLRSIQTLPGDEILVAGKIYPTGDTRPRLFPCQNGNDWGCKERTLAIAHAQGQYLAFIDDDDCYVPGARLMMEEAIREAPARPILFRMRYPSGLVLWQDQAVRCGNVGTPMILIPNMPTKLGTWSTRYEQDFHFLETMKWKADDIVWRPEVIAHIGHNV